MEHTHWNILNSVVQIAGAHSVDHPLEWGLGLPPRPLRGASVLGDGRGTHSVPSPKHLILVNVLLVSLDKTPHQ